MEVFMIRAAMLLLSLSILVLVHELGHFLFARLFKVRVEKFYMFFNPLFSIFRAKRIDGKLRFSWFSRKAPESFQAVPEKTEFGLGWVPLGGYCSIAGMIDESMNKDAMAEPEKEWEFRTKKPLPRLLIMVGGVLFNFILALVLYAGILFAWGDEYLPASNAKMGMDFSPYAHSIGFKDGDRLVSADGVAFERYDDNAMRIMGEASAVVVRRDTQEISIQMPQNFMEELIESKQGFATYRFPTVIKEVVSGSVCAGAGLLPGDSLTSIGGVGTVTFFDFVEQLGKHKEKEVTIAYFRNGKPGQVSLTPDANGKIGFQAKLAEEIYPTRHESYTFLQSIPEGISRGIKTLTGYASDMKYAFTKAGAQSLGGFGTLGKLFPANWDWLQFWQTTAFLSIILAFMNILPIPALDGGHILFVFYEMIFRRKPSQKFMEWAQTIGMFLLLALLLYANGNDLYRLLFK